jgi:PAS domain S-box-containing protein
MDEKKKVLILEDIPYDAELVEQEFKKTLKNYTLQVTDNEKGFIEALKNYKPDIILSDYNLPQFNGMEAIKLAKEISPLIPVIIVTGSINEEIAVECIKAGAKDYVIKENLIRLGPAVSQALENITLIEDRIKAEKALQENEEKYRTLFETAHDAIFMADAESGMILDANMSASILTGYSKEELIGRHQSFLHPKSETEKYSANFKKAVVAKGTVFTEIDIVHKDGSVIPVEISSGGITIISGKQVHLGIFRDISERKLAEKKIQESVQKLTSHLQNTPVIYIEWDLDFKVLEWNNTAVKTLGYTKKEAMGKHAAELIVPESTREQVDNLWRDLMNKKEGNHSINENVTKEGKTIICEWNNTSLIDGSGNIIGVASLVQDITDRKQAEETLKESEEKYRNLIETTSEGFWLLDSDQKTIDVNQSLCDMLGYSRSEMIGKMPFDFFDEENLKILKEQTSQIASTLHRTYDINIKKKNGTNLPAISNATSLIDKNGKPVGSFALVTDITERKLVEEELRLNRVLLRNVLDIVPIFICAKNLDGKFILVNKKLTDFYGSTVEAMTNVIHADLCEDENELRAMLADDREVIESGKPKFIPEETMENPDGSITILETYKIPFDAQGEPAVLIASNEITERKKAEESLKHRMRELEIFNEASVNRELLINDHRKEINELLEKLGKKPKYRVVG